MDVAVMGAREEAERRWPNWLAPEPDCDSEQEYSTIEASWQNAESEMQRNAFVQGAAWAFEATDERVEAMARSSFELFADPYELVPWYDVSETDRRAWLEDAREALAALRRAVL